MKNGNHLNQSNPIKVYLSARISIDAHEWNNKVCNTLTDPIEVFLPQEHNPYNVQHEKLEKEVYEIDLKAMQESDMGLLLPPYGRDCAWEVGWYANSDKPLIVYIDDQIDWLRDWMIKGGLDYVFTTNINTYEALKSDPILKHRHVEYLPSLSDFKHKITEIHTSKKASCDLMTVTS